MTPTTPEKGAEGDSLQPCPFCGGKPHLVTRNVEPQGDPWYGKKEETFILCDCGACLFDGMFHEGFYDAETRAVEAWNRRASSPAPADSQLRAAIEQEREAFELWFASQKHNGFKRPNRADSGDGYYTQSTQRMWEAWQARAAIRSTSTGEKQ